VQRAIAAIGASWTGVSQPASFGRPRTLMEARAQALSLFVTKGEFERVFKRFDANALLVGNFNVAFFARDLARRCPASVFRIPNPPILDAASAKGQLLRSVWRAVADAFDFLVCNSTYTAEAVAEVVGDASNIRLIRNFAPALRSQPAQPAPRLSPERRHVMYLGQISEAKGVGVLIDAAATVAHRANVDFVLAGPGVWRDSFVNQARARAASAGLEDRVFFIGPVEDVAGLLAQGHVHVCPSLSPGDSFPNVILDAKQAGLPSIVFPTAGLPEAVVDGVDGIVARAPTAEALGAALLDVLNDEARRARMAAAARASLAAFDAETLTDQWLSLFLKRA
jgi:D-inositol-3-phosphate glycosyltransferase